MIASSGVLLRATALAVVVALAACGGSSPRPATARPDPRGFLRAIELCKTTETDLRAQLGEPTRDGLLRRARILSWIIGDSDPVAYVAVMLDAGGTVVDLYWDVPTEIPWTPADQCTPP